MMAPLSFRSCSRLSLLLFCGLSTGCSLFVTRTEVEERPANPLSPKGQAPFPGNPILPGPVDPQASYAHVSTQEELEKIDNGAEGELMWTDPDNPDAEIPGLAEAFENKRKGNGWLQDFNRGKKLARQEGRPLVIWFHDSIASPKSKELGASLLETPAFNEWCNNRVIRVKLDSGESIDDSRQSAARYSMRAINRLQRRYGLKSKPALAVISPQGKIKARIEGKDSYFSEVELSLKSAIVEVERDYQEYRNQLRPLGFRDWHSRRGNLTLFAKLQRYDEAKNLVYLKEPGGHITRTPLDHFSKEDIAYLDEQARSASTR